MARMKKLDRALWLARQGFRVFPCYENTKTPAVEHWKEDATSDLDKVRETWTSRPALNIAIATGEWGGPGYVYITDADVKFGAPGMLSLETMFAVDGLDDGGLRVKSPTGGEHHYACCEPVEGVTISAARIPNYPGIDVRGPGGFVMAPDSSIDGKFYDIMNEPEDLDTALAADAHVPEAPEWLRKAWRSAQGMRPVGGSTVTPIVDLDQEHHVDAAKDWLREAAEVAVQGARGSTLYRVAARLRDFGLSESTAFAAILSDYADGKILPPIPDDEILVSVQNAYRYAVGTWGGAAAEADFEDATEGEEEAVMMAGLESRPTRAIFAQVPKSKRKLFAVPFDESADIGDRQALPPLVKKIVDKGTMTVIYGASNVGKTFVAMSMGYAVAAGLDEWFGFRVKGDGAVLYISAEGGAAIHMRTRAMRLKRPEGRSDGQEVAMHIVPCAVDLFAPDADLTALLALGRSIEQTYSRKLEMVFVDTLARTIGAGDENTAKDMGVYVTNVDRLRHDLRCATVIVHHSGKDASLGARGSGSLKAATDTEIEVLEGSIVIQKQRNMPKVETPIGFALESVRIGVDEDGDEVTSAVAVPAALAAAVEDFEDATGDLSKEAGEALLTLRDGPFEGFTMLEWIAAYNRGRIARKGPKAAFSSRHAHRFCDEVIDAGYAVQGPDGRYTEQRDE